MGAHYREHRAEDLFLVDPHVFRHIVEQAAAHIKTVLIALHLEAAAIDRELGAFLDTDLDIILDAIEGCLGHQRTVIRGGVDRRTDL